ncbi:MAG: type II secretion system F family protein [Sedimentisphaerales bacterium]|nr:type II secretion system F family protein [Sedimentisphaerales bacterium]
MNFSATKITDELDSKGKGQELPPLSNKQGQDRYNADKFHYNGTDSNSRSIKDYGPIQEKDTLPVNVQLCRSKVNQAELILFTTQLSVMLDSGVVLSDALDAIAEQSEHGTFKMVIMDVAETVKNGDNFSRALAEYPKIFNKMFISMVKASEASGRMADMLNVLSGYLNFESETRKRIKGALTYPFIMALMAVAATGTLMFFVLPRFMRIYESKGASLPKITQVVVGFSRFIGDFQSMTIFLTGLILTSVGLYYFSGTLTGRRAIDFIKIRTPVLGTMFVDTIVTRSMRIMATMLNTGVNLLDSIAVIQGSCDNYYFRQLWVGVNDKIRDGYQLSESIMISPSSYLMAPGIIQMLKAGEKSGKLGEVCDKISVFYEKKLEASIRNVMALIEPIMITILGCVIGTIAIALLLPVFRISNVIAH